MRNGFLGSITILLAGIGVAVGQPTPSSPPTQTPPGAPTPVAPVAPLPGSPAPAAGQPAAVPAFEPARSPYWPSPANCFTPACGTGGCGADGANYCEPGSPPTEFNEVIWGGAEYLVWWVKDGPLGLPLVTTGPAGSLGILGAPGTAVLYGESDLNYEAFSGGRATLGIWLDKCAHRWGWESSGFFLERRTTDFLAVSSVTGAPVLARPFLNAAIGAEDALLVSAPGQFAGDIGIGSSSSMYGVESNIIYANFCNQSDKKVDMLVGLRYVTLREDLGAFQTSTLLPGGTAGFAGQIITPPGTLNLIDRIQTRNEFYGGQIGARGEYRMGRLILNARGKLAFGSTHEIAAVDGASQLSGATAAGGGAQPPSTVPGALWAVSSNLGRYSRDRFSVMPEFGFNVGYQFCTTVTAFMGYTFLYWSDVARPGDQVSHTVNSTLVPASQTFGVPVGPPQPTPPFEHSTFWAQGLNFGLEIRY